MSRMPLRLRALLDLLARYGGAFGHAWRARGEQTPPERLPWETQFLPAALALQETPVSPAPRVAMRLLMAFTAIAVAWSVIGRVDVVSTAHGKVIPSSRSKVVQPLDAATVTAIHVREGQRVRAGDLLLELDATVETADSTRIAGDLMGDRLLAARSEAFLRALRGGAATLGAVPGVPEARLRQEQQLLQSEVAEHRLQLSRMDAEIARRGAELRSLQEVVRGLERTAPIARQRADDIKRLADQELVSRHDYLEQERIALQAAGELAAQRERVSEVRAALDEASRQRGGLAAEAERAAMDRLREAGQRGASSTQELAKARRRGSRTRLTAPVDGTVQQLAVSTVGGVVTPAEALMVIVPERQPLEVEAVVENKDVGFVHAGQRAEVKVETFPYTRYGTLHARVQHVSAEAVADEQRGLVYAARVTLEQGTIIVDGRSVPLTPGMAVTVEIKLARRRVIEFFLAPLLRRASEGLRER
jgi:hemolysin D